MRLWRQRQGGFTLVEMMVVIAIMALLTAAAGATLRNVMKSDLRSAANKTANLLHFAFDRGAIGGEYYRVVLDIDNSMLSLETSEDRVTLRSAEQEERYQERQKEAEERRQRKIAPTPSEAPAAPATAGPGGMFDLLGPMPDPTAVVEQYQEDLEPLRRSDPVFAPYKGVGTTKFQLPGNVTVRAVMTPRLAQPLTKGKAYVYFFPQGHAEPAIIHLSNDDQDYYSVVLHPLTGRTEVFNCRYRIPKEYDLKESERGDDEQDRDERACE